MCKDHYSMKPVTNGLSKYEFLVPDHERDMKWRSSDHNYKKQNTMMNDDSVNEHQISLTKENCGPVFISRFSQQLQRSFKHQYMSQSLCFYASHYGHTTFRQPYDTSLKWTASHTEISVVKILYDTNWNIKSMHTVNSQIKCAIYGVVFVFYWDIH